MEILSNIYKCKFRVILGSVDMLCLSDTVHTGDESL